MREILKSIFQLRKQEQERRMAQDEAPESGSEGFWRDFMSPPAFKRSPAYSQWRKNGKRADQSKREYRDWRKGKRSSTTLEGAAAVGGGTGLERRSSGMGFKQWRKTG